jgi:Protein of unknown function, DUF481
MTFARRTLQPALSAAALLVVALSMSSTASPAQQPGANPAPKPSPDVIVFTNGDQLTGSLERAVGGSVVFKSDMAGEITVSFDKVKELKSSARFAVLRSDRPISQRPVTAGTLVLGDKTLTVAAPDRALEQVPTAKVGYVIDQATYERELEKKPGLLYGWNGALNGGATIVRSTDYGESFTAGIALVRALPTVAWLPARNRTSFDLQETYGKLTSPVIPQTKPASPAAVTLTSIFHTDAERDEFFSPRFFALGQTAFDHNYSQGLNLQQVYGGGIGWTAIKSPKQELDLKATIQYEKQQFFIASSNLNLIGSTISEAYHRNLPRKLLFSESLNVLPAFNTPKAYSANGSVGLAMPVFKRLSLLLTATDNFLNNPSTGYQKNSFQFVTAASYSLH